MRSEMVKLWERDYELNKRQNCHHIKTNQLIYMIVTLAFDELNEYGI